MYTQIIAYGGRKYSGKSVAAKMTADILNCDIYSFATPLKKICARILDISVDELITLKNDNTEINFDVTQSAMKDLTDLTGLHSVDIMSKLPLHKVFHNVREMLQFIGTEVICEIDKKYWVKNVMHCIENSNTKYAIIDDLRFLHEYDEIENNNGRACFIIRPVFKHISNHISETSLTWSDYDNIICNYIDTPENGLDLQSSIKQFLNATEKYINVSKKEMYEGYIFGHLDNVEHSVDISKDIYLNNKDNKDFIQHGLFHYHPSDEIIEHLKALHCERFNGDFYSAFVLENFKKFAN